MELLFDDLTALHDSVGVECTVRADGRGETYALELSWSKHLVDDRFVVLKGVVLDDLVATAKAIIEADLAV
jgi:hypothetical protein